MRNFLLLVLTAFVFLMFGRSQCYAQTQSIILGPNNEIVGQIVTYPPIPQWR